MPRKPSIEYPGAIYHVMSRANGKNDVFLNDVDRQSGTASPLEISRRGEQWTPWTVLILVGLSEGINATQMSFAKV